ncbi:MAG: maleylpyruvate isomerase N-terminal domain-containing protein [Actinobacteria bacterium]|nr:maleylpyruvate isomerase N-terminal domain-containing protein [Actinomycetota bacterium]MCA1719960.1 maleylpyruvate isomerase N-terminal domain-containing protein [Actinomycetota bacterium]
MLASGLSDSSPAELGPPVLTAWDAFLELAASADLARPSRLPGWTGKDVCTHLGSWPGHDVVDSLLASARKGGAGEAPDPDASNARLVEQHRAAPDAEVLAALQRGRDSLARFFASEDAREWGRAAALSAVGPLPVLSLLHAGCYELAVHALDLAPCGAAAPPPQLLDRGLAALMDVTGALSARAGIDIALTAQTPDGGWSFTSASTGWTTDRVLPGRLAGTGVRGSAADLLDASAGRTNLGQLLLTRRLVVHQLPSFMRLAPLLHEVPGLPGGAALKTAVAGLGSVTKVLGRFRR